jgi:hypothetical protein
MRHLLVYSVTVMEVCLSAVSVFADDTVASLTCGISTEPCPSGCWNSNGVVGSDGTRYCHPVSRGFYSLVNNDDRYPCEPGYYSNQDAADICEPCPWGTYAPQIESKTCTPCPPGSYNPYFGSDWCSTCDQGIYDGTGSDFTLSVGGIRYCLEPPPNEFLSYEPYSSPSQTPPLSPTAIFTSTPTAAPSEAQSQMPSGMPSENPSVSPSVIPSTISPTISDPADGSPSQEESSDDENDTNDFEGLESWQYLPILACLVLLFLLIKRCWKDFNRSKSLRERPIPAPPSEPKPSDIKDHCETSTDCSAAECIGHEEVGGNEHKLQDIEQGGAKLGDEKSIVPTSADAGPDQDSEDGSSG